MLYHEWAGVFKAGQARGCVHYEESSYWPGPSLLLFAVFPSSGGDIKLTEKPARASECEPGRVFNQPGEGGVGKFPGFRQL